MGPRLLAGRNALTGEAVGIEVVGDRITAVRSLASGSRARTSGEAAPTSGEARGAAADDLPWISPGFVDLQVNGYAGHDYSSEGLTREDIRAIVRGLAASGTTQHVPTIVTAPRERIARNLRVIAGAADSDPLLGEAIVGIHVEGPFISGEDGPRGAHPRAFVRPPDYEELREWVDAAGGRLAYITLAPELPGAIELIEKAVRLGVRVAIGHTAAMPEVIARAIEAGATLSTHLGNGSHPLLPRHRNPLWEQLASDRLSAGIICDGFHLPPALVKVIARVKPAGRLFLVSDTAPLAGLPAGRYEWLGGTVEVSADGRLSLAGGEILAGAGHLLDRGIACFLTATGLPLAEALPLVTSVPAGLVGASARVGRLEAGAKASLTLFRTEEGGLRIEETLLAGERLFGRRPEA